MGYQQMSLFKEQESEEGNSPVFQGASHASRIRLQECVKRLVMNVTCGRSIGESLMSLDPNGSWLKMYGDSYQVNLDGSFEEYSGTLPTWGMMLDGVVTELPMSERFIPENGLPLLPTPVASDCGPVAIIGENDTFRKTSSGTLRKVNKNGKDGSLGLTRTLKLLPTPTANTCKGFCQTTAKRIIAGVKQRDSGAQIGSCLNFEPSFLPVFTEGKKNIVNPLFVEMMMGFPKGWTEINASEMP